MTWTPERIAALTDPGSFERGGKPLIDYLAGLSRVELIDLVDDGRAADGIPWYAVGSAT